MKSGLEGPARDGGKTLQAREGCDHICASKRRGTDGFLFRTILRLFALQTALEDGDSVSPAEGRFICCPVY